MLDESWRNIQAFKVPNERPIRALLETDILVALSPFGYGDFYAHNQPLDNNLSVSGEDKPKPAYHLDACSRYLEHSLDSIPPERHPGINP